jgi:Domain of unknown function (DUF1998)
MSNDQIRLSQIITTFGPGAMVDLPNHSVVISGLDHWKDDTTSKPIVEPRLSERLERDFAEKGLIEDGDRISLKTPPRLLEKDNVKPGVEAFVFPNWFVANRVESTKGEALQKRRLLKWSALEPGKGQKRVFKDESGKSVDVTPIRFVAGCKKGHLQDLEWHWLVHGNGSKCRQTLWLEERGTSASPEDTSVVCDCGARFNLRNAFAPKRLGGCGGKRPWLLKGGNTDDEACTEDLKFLTRTATNTYFPQVVSVISLPEQQDELQRLLSLGEFHKQFQKVESLSDVAIIFRLNTDVSEAFADFSPEEVWNALSKPRVPGTSISLGFHAPEYDLFASGQDKIGNPKPGSTLYAETLPRSGWDFSPAKYDATLIQAVVAVHQLREVVCLYGFTRFDAPPAMFDDGLEEVKLSVEGARLSRKTSWLPAMEQFGEGMFVQLDATRINDWLKRDPVKKRERLLADGFAKWRQKTNYKGDFPGAAYVLTHSLAHALMTEIALECGYPSSALKERVYALREQGSGKGTGFSKVGLLIYSASSGAQGTLGGIVAQTQRFGELLDSALSRLEYCSNDPICADHDPGQKDDDRRLLGAACPSCLLAPETSCEKQNLFLDRALLVETLARNESAAFS